MADDEKEEGFAKWRAKNPEPSSEDPVARFGGYHRIPPEAWQEFDRAMEEWRAKYKLRHLGN